jgi:transcription elongation factor Elf1
MSTYVKLEKAPEFVLNYPSCGTCLVDLEHDGDQFTCPSCGTCWDSYASDGDQGDLYSDWSGEPLEGPLLSESQAQDVAYYRERLDRHIRWGSERSALWPKPSPPRGLPDGFVL